MRPPTRVVAFYFGRQGRNLFGCFHEPLQRSIRRCAVLICQPIGHEYINSHRALRQLAARLAEAGFPVLRFDYYGCGDSSGHSEEGSISLWMEDISTALAELRTRAGLSKVYIVGLRLGGTLAAIAGTQSNDVEGLVLWDPVVNGKNHFQEMLSLQKEMLCFRPKPRRSFVAIARLLRKYSDRRSALAQRTLPYFSHNSRLLFSRRLSGLFLQRVRATTIAKLVRQVSGLSTVAACPPGLARAQMPDGWHIDPPRCTHSQRHKEVLGFPVSRSLQSELEQLDLLTIAKCPAANVLILENPQLESGDALKDCLSATCARVEHQQLEAPQIWLPTADGSLLVPATVLRSVVSWICGAAS